AVVMDRYLAPAGETAVWRVARDGDPVGLVFLGPHAETAGAEVSYQFAPKVWGAGVAFEAVSEVLRWAQDPCGAPCAVAETQAANLRSLGLLRRLGFTEARRFHRFGAEQVLVIRPLGPRGT
ncbi:MAG: GNAT family N-acetyltransferase, partial [Pseudomonadota bacterium]